MEVPDLHSRANLLPEADAAKNKIASDPADLFRSELMDGRKVQETQSTANIIRPKTDSEKQSLSVLQARLIDFIERKDLPEAKKEQILLGLKLESGLKSKAKEVDAGLMGAATKEALEIYKSQIAAEMKAAVSFLFHAQDSIPAGLFVQLADFGKRKQSPEGLLRDLSESNLELEIPISSQAIPELEKLKLLERVMNSLSENIAKVVEKRALKAAAELAKDRGQPWSIGSYADSQKAVIVISKLDSIKAQILALDGLQKQAADPSIIGDLTLAENKNEISKYLKAIPSIVSLERDLDGQIKNVSFNLPNDLILDSPAWTEALKSLDDWQKDSRKPIDGLADEILRRPKSETIAAWENLALAKGWVKISGAGAKQNAIIKIQESRPEGGDWRPFNRLCHRAHCLERVNESGNKELRLVTERSFYHVPVWGYQDLFASCQARIEIEDKNWRRPDDWTLVKDSSGKVVPMRMRDINVFMQEQEAFHRSHQAVQVTMDLALILEGGGAALGALESMKAASSAAGTLNYLRGGAEALSSGTGALRAESRLAGQLMQSSKLVNSLESNYGHLRYLQSTLAGRAEAQLFDGASNALLGASGFFLSSPAVRENSLLSTLADFRSNYFTYSIFRHCFFDPLASRVELAGLAGLGKNQLSPQLELLLQASKEERQPALMKACEQVAGRAFLWTQAPLGSLVVRDIILGWQATSDAGSGTAEFLDDLIASYLKADTASSAFAPKPGTIARADAARLKSFASASGTASPETDRILSESLRLLEEKPSENQEKELEIWRNKRDEFIAKDIASIFLASASEIKELEIKRAFLNPDAESRPALEADEIERLSKISKKEAGLGCSDPGLLQVAASCMLILMRGEKERERPGAGHELLFERSIKPEAWTMPHLSFARNEYDFFKINFAPALKPEISFAPPSFILPRFTKLDYVSPASTRGPIKQEICLSELKDILAKNLSVGDSSSSSPASSFDEAKFEKLSFAGDLLAERGLCQHQYASCLLQLLGRKDLPEGMQVQIVLKLSDLAFALGEAEARLNAAESARYKLLHAGLDSGSLLSSLLDWSSANENSRAKSARLLALYAVFQKETGAAAGGAALKKEIAEAILAFDTTMASKKIESVLLASAFAKIETPADAASKLQALKLLARNPDLLPACYLRHPVAKEDILSAELIACSRASSLLESPAAGNYSRGEILSLCASSALALSELACESKLESGIRVNKLAALDSSRDPKLRQEAMVLRKELVAKIAGGNEANYLHLLKLLPELLSSPANASCSQELAALRRSYAEFLLRALSGDTKMEEEKEVISNWFGKMPILLEESFYSLAQLDSMDNKDSAWEPMREKACSLAIGIFSDRRCDPFLRFAALKYLAHSLDPQKLQEFSERELLLENDPAIALELKGYCPQSSEDKVQDYLERPPLPLAMSSSQLPELLKKFSLQALLPELRQELFYQKAMANLGSFHFRQLAIGFSEANLKTESGLILGNRTKVFDYLEMKEQREIWQDTKLKFKQLCLKASAAPAAAQRPEAAEARQLLYAIACSKESQWQNSWDKSPFSSAQQSQEYKLLSLPEAEFESIRKQAADALVAASMKSSGSSLSSQTSIPDQEMRDLRKLLAGILENAEGLYESKLKALDALYLLDARSDQGRACGKLPGHIKNSLISALELSVRSSTNAVQTTDGKREDAENDKIKLSYQLKIIDLLEVFIQEDDAKILLRACLKNQALPKEIRLRSAGVFASAESAEAKHPVATKAEASFFSTGSSCNWSELRAGMESSLRRGLDLESSAELCPSKAREMIQSFYNLISHELESGAFDQNPALLAKAIDECSELDRLICGMSEKAILERESKYGQLFGGLNKRLEAKCAEFEKHLPISKLSSSEKCLQFKNYRRQLCLIRESTGFELRHREAERSALLSSSRWGAAQLAQNAEMLADKQVHSSLGLIETYMKQAETLQKDFRILQSEGENAGKSKQFIRAWLFSDSDYAIASLDRAEEELKKLTQKSSKAVLIHAGQIELLKNRLDSLKEQLHSASRRLRSPG